MNRFEILVENTLPSCISTLNKASTDTSFWALVNLGIDLYDNQIDITNAVCDLSLPYVAILASRGSGKTYSVAIALVKMCLDNPGFRVGIFGPKGETSKRLVKEDIIGRILSPSSSVYNQIDWNKTSNALVVFKNGSTIKALSASETATQESEHFHCVVDSTEVITKNGKKKIADVTVGDEVLSYNLDKNIVEFKLVTNVAKNILKKKLYKIITESGNELVCTQDHRIFTKNRGYVEAQNLTTEDIILEIGKDYADLSNL